ncbi:FecR family protein [Dysgonomonas sp. ZJ709]|uniref:FecR family protein n=1 Tax=Dysgonomonas sp. ZJ709 TaxID=2709797 RepID=UPI0013ED1B03|nr:FecR family protein [Dysgonomonas sp. ZJ709]
MKDYSKYNSINDFIFDSEFVELVKKNNQREIESIIASFPDKEALVKDAILLLRYFTIEEEKIEEGQIEEDLTDLLHQIRQRNKKKKRMLFVTSLVAASIAVFLFTIPYSNTDKPKEAKIEIFSLLDQMNVDMDEVHIVNGKSNTYIDNNETIEQKEDGGVIIRGDEKIESSDIENEYLQVVVPNGKRTSIRFSDGSLIKVNSGSKIIYPKQFSSTSRDIYIDGEAYLEIASDDTKPFFVHTKLLDVAVFGTKFNINAYSADAEGSVVLVEGSVEVASSENKRLLKPNQGLFYKDGKTELKDVDVSFYISWIDGIMKLKGDHLSTILNNLSRYYKLDIRFSNRLSNEVYKGKINLNDSIETILNNISLSTPLSYTRNGNTIYIK